MTAELASTFDLLSSLQALPNISGFLNPTDFDTTVVSEIPALAFSLALLPFLAARTVLTSSVGFRQGA